MGGDRKAALDAIARYVDGFVASLIRVAAQDDEPLVAFARILAGEDDRVGAAAGTSDVRSSLFNAYNAYDPSNLRALAPSALFAFLQDYINAFAAAIAELAPDLASGPDDTWQGRERWDAMGDELADKAVGLAKGFGSDGELWTRRWAAFLSASSGSRGGGVRYAELQAALAGHRTADWLRELSKCSMLAQDQGKPGGDREVILRTPRGGGAQPLAQQASREELNASYVHSVGPALAPLVTSPTVWRSASSKAVRDLDNSATGVPSAARDLQPSMTVDIAQAASSIRQHQKTQFAFLLFAWHAGYLVLLAVTLSLQVTAGDTRAAHAALVQNIVDRPFEASRHLQDVRSVADVHAWLSNVYVPYVFAAAPARSVLRYNAIAATPFLRQRRKRVEPGCDADFNLEAYPAPDSRCFRPGDFSPGPIAGAASGASYAAVDYDGPYQAPKAGSGGTDFVVYFDVLGSVPAAGPAAFEVASVADAAAAVDTLRRDRWFDEGSAFLEAHALLYTPDLDVLSEVKVVFTVDSAGVVTPLAGRHAPYGSVHRGSHLSSSVVAMYDTGRTAPDARLALEIVLLVATISEFFAEGVRAFRVGRRTGAGLRGYIEESAWNPFSLFFYVLLVVVFGLHLGYAAQTDLRSGKTGGATLDDEPAIPATDLDTIRPAFVALNATLLVLATVRVLRPVGRMHESIRRVSRLLRVIGPALLVFSLFLLLACLVFAFVGYHFFGPYAAGYSTFGSALVRTFTFFFRGAPAPDEFRGVFADPSVGSFPPLFLWARAGVLLLQLAAVAIAIFTSAYDASVVQSDRVRKENHDVPSTGRMWSRRTVLFQCSNYPSSLLAHWCEHRAVAPVARSHAIRAVASAEVVGGGNLRVLISTKRMDDIRGCSGVVFVLPPEMLRDQPAQNRAEHTRFHGLFTRCRAGHEPRKFPRPNWCQYTGEWWMRAEYLDDFVAGGALWRGKEEGVADIAAPAAEVHRRSLWLAEKARGIALVPCDAEHFVSTTFVPYAVGNFRSRHIRVLTTGEELLSNGGRTADSWDYQSLVFEFPDVTSSRWPLKLLPVTGVYRTCQHASRGCIRPQLVVVVGEQPVPHYICGHRERYTSEELLEPFERRPGIRTYIEEIVLGRFGISNERRAA
ncbi:Polycystin-2 [Diplonema papillatum]|nr:Polycystin-2 [Diplonema papillatum]